MAPTNAAATGVWTAQQKNNARQGRDLIQSLFGNSDAAPMNGARSGVIATVGAAAGTIRDLQVLVTAGLTMSVNAGTALAHRSGQGPYPGWLNASVNVTCDTAPVSNPRNDIVIFRMYDAAQGDTVPGSGPAQIEVVTGTPSGSPVDPVTPNALGVITTGFGAGGGVAVPLARAQVSTGGVITLTDIRRSCGLIGGPRLLLPGDSDSLGKVGDLRMNGNVLEIYNQAGAWTSVFDATYSAEIGGEYRASALQALTTGLNKLNFGTTVRATNGLTWNGSNQFTVVVSGLYAMQASVYMPGTSNHNILIGTSAASLNANVHVHGNFSSTGLSAACAGTVYLTAGTTISAYCYLNSANASTSFSTEPAEFKVWRVRSF